MNKIRPVAAALGAVVVLLNPASLTARAEEPVETAIKAWVAAIDASPSWAASYRGLTYDAGTATAVLTGLSVKAEAAAFTALFETISVAGYRETADGGFAASLIKADGGAIEALFAKIAITDVELKDLTTPPSTGYVYDPARPFTSLIRLYDPVVKSKLNYARVGSVTVLQELEGATSRISYEQFEIEGLTNGKIASLRSGPLKMEAPSPEGLVHMTVGGVEGRDFDFDAFLHVYDPDRYVGGVGDMTWRSAMSTAAYHDFVLESPGLKMSIARLGFDNFRLRQPKRSFTPFIDEMMAHPEMPESEMDTLASRNIVNMLAAFSIGRFSIDTVRFDIPGVDRAELAKFEIVDLSLDGLGKFGFDGLDGQIAAAGLVKVGHFAFGDIIFPTADAIEAAIAAEESGIEPDVKVLIPKLGFLEASAVEIETPEVPLSKLASMRVDFRNYIGPVPTSIGVDIAGVDFPVDALDDAESKELFAAMGYDRISIDYALKIDWKEADESIAVSDLRIALKDMGVIAADAVLVGLDRSAIEEPETLGDALPTLSLKSGRFSFKDESVVGRSLAIAAEKMKVPPDKFRQQFADAMPFLLSISVLGDPATLKVVKETGVLAKLTPVVKDFLAVPGGTFTMIASPPTPVPIEAVGEALDNAPQTLLSLLGLSFTGEKGAEVPSDKPEEMRKSIDPAN